MHADARPRLVHRTLAHGTGAHHVDHRLDGEAVANLHHAFGLVTAVVRDRRRLVERLADPVPAVRPVDGEAALAHVRADRLTEVAVARAGLALRDGERERVVRALDELFGRGRDRRGRADDESLVQVRIEAVLRCGARGECARGVKARCSPGQPAERARGEEEASCNGACAGWLSLKELDNTQKGQRKMASKGTEQVWSEQHAAARRQTDTHDDSSKRSAPRGATAAPSVRG